jgi:hypothetical protein
LAAVKELVYLLGMAKFYCNGVGVLQYTLVELSPKKIKSLFLCLKLPKKIPFALCDRESELLNELQKWITGTFRYETLELVIELVVCKLTLL